ncbi:hypothetical protein Cflav_PD4168 [Pedosphaera parvula Ellin514]|uniref:Uncharacterized protein n=1 Tax=Pedosphaera parvula (strain Ellin514) TaxID=320771 RepID=B9XEZ2_PEDPL|nr:hypothetical protein Cflav_PD4168 [Pedosphaera parvula Ellin514]
MSIGLPICDFEGTVRKMRLTRWMKYLFVAVEMRTLAGIGLMTCRLYLGLTSANLG